MSFAGIIKKLLYGFLVVLGVIIIITTLFFSFLSNDGKAVYEMTGQNTNQETINKIKKEYALDRPVYEQVLLYINDVMPLSIHNNQNTDNPTFLTKEKYSYFQLLSFGNKSIVLKAPYFKKSYQTNQSVAAILKASFPATLVLAFSAIIFATFFGILLGITSALIPNSWLDKIILIISTLGMALPSFFVAVLLSWLFGFLWNQYTGLNTWGSLYEIDDFTGEKTLMLKNLILPALALGIRPLSVIVQLTRNTLLEVLSSDYIRTAKAKGLNPFQVIYKHALKNIMNPIITAISGWLGGMLAGAVFIEYVFGWKGLGKVIVDGLQKLDYPVVIGAVILVAFLFVIINILVDLLYAIIDPRVRI